MKSLFRGEGSVQQVFMLSLPLILSNISIALMSFADRVFLGWFDAKALAGSLPAAAMSFGVSALFLGTASYVGTFVAQYEGAGLRNKMGSMIWQGLYFSLLTLPVIPLLFWISPWIFGPFQKDPQILEYEIIYFNRLSTGVVPLTITFALSSFFSGTGRTWPVFWINNLAMLINLVLDYGLIFGKFGLPAWGVAGAAWATVYAQWVGVLAYGILLWKESKKGDFGFSEWAFHWESFKKLIRYGFPAGVHFFADVVAFTLFMLLLGNLGESALAASNMAFQIHFLAFMPLTGIGLGLSILVGQFMGEQKPELAQKSLLSAVLSVGTILGV